MTIIRSGVFGAFVSLVLMSNASVASQAATSRVSVDSAGNQANGSSDAPAISGDGRYVAFPSFASNLVPGDSNGTYDIFVHDRDTAKTERVSVGIDGSEANDSSQTAALVHVRISDDGRLVAFASLATNLTPDGIPGVFVRDRQDGVTTLVSFNQAGRPIEGSVSVCDLSGDARFVTYRAGTRLFLRDLSARSSSLIAAGAGCGNLSGDGRFVVYTDTTSQVLLLDRESGVTETVSVNAAGEPANEMSDWPSISSDSRFVAFETLASNLDPGDSNGVTDVYLRDRASGTITLVSKDEAGLPAGGSLPQVSGSGGQVLFKQGTGLGSLLVHDSASGQREKVSLNSLGENANAAVPENTPAPQALSADGRFVAFETAASNLVENDTNEAGDVFLRDRGGPGTATVSPPPVESDSDESGPALSTMSVIGAVVGLALLVGIGLLVRRRRARRP
jgi:Tol biopolymer transport system component